MSDQLPAAASYPSNDGSFRESRPRQRGADASGDGRPDALFNARTRASRLGLQLRPGITFDEWTRIGVQVGSLADASAWWIGDWLNFGRTTYPSRYRTAIDATGFSYQTLRNYASVAAQFPVYRRRDSLSFGHHAEVASLPVQEQDSWLTQAAFGRWSRNGLRSRLRHRLRSLSETAATPVAIALQVEDDRHEFWRAAATANRSTLYEWIIGVLDAAAAVTITETG